MQNEQTVSPEVIVFNSMKAWFVCLSAGLFFFYDFIQLNMFNTLNPHIAEYFNLNASQLGYFGSIYMAASVCMLPFSGALLDRYPTRVVILTAMAICTSSTLMFSLATNIYVAGLARFICGASTAFCFLSCLVLSSRWFPSQKMAQITGVIVTMAFYGGYISQKPLSNLINAIGWQKALQVDTFLGVLLLVLMYFSIENYPDKNNPPELTNEPIITSYSAAFSNTQNIICGLYTSLMNLFIFVFGAAWGASYLHHVYKLDFTTATQITGMLYLGTIIGSPLAGIISDSLGKRRSPMIIGAVISFLLAFSMLFRPELSINQMSAVFFILGLTTSTQILSYPVIFETNSPSITGASEALAGVLIMSGGAIFQTIFGKMIEAHWSGLLSADGTRIYSGGDFHFAYLIFPCSLLICIWLACCIKETNCKQQWQNTSGSE